MILNASNNYTLAVIPYRKHLALVHWWFCVQIYSSTNYRAFLVKNLLFLFISFKLKIVTVIYVRLNTMSSESTYEYDYEYDAEHIYMMPSSELRQTSFRIHSMNDIHRQCDTNSIVRAQQTRSFYNNPSNYWHWLEKFSCPNYWHILQNTT